MPYLKSWDREQVDKDGVCFTAGELNYKITKACIKYLGTPAYADGKYNYSKINEIIGVLECCKQEFYRRIAAPYEDKKIEENGDVYP